jgi:hypothetical protein
MHFLWCFTNAWISDEEKSFDCICSHPHNTSCFRRHRNVLLTRNEVKWEEWMRERPQINADGCLSCYTDSMQPCGIKTHYNFWYNGWSQMIPKQITIRVNGDCDPIRLAKPYKLALVISLFLQKPACRNILDLGRFYAPSVDCPLHSMLLAVDSVFISSHYALQVAITFVSHRHKSRYAFA